MAYRWEVSTALAEIERIGTEARKTIGAIDSSHCLLVAAINVMMRHDLLKEWREETAKVSRGETPAHQHERKE